MEKLSQMKWKICGLNQRYLNRRRRNTSLLKHQTAFSLIELLIVVSIISILAAIAVPNFLEAQTRAKVSRVKADMRSLATAVESYRVDNNRYPHRNKWPAGGSFQGMGDVTRRITEGGTGQRGDLTFLTTPISYISTIPVDVFENRVAAPNNVIDYYDAKLVQHLRRGLDPGIQFDYQGAVDSNSSGFYDVGWMLLSVGPDGHLGNSSSVGNYPTRVAYTTWIWEYDPTNGTVSEGNVTRFSSPSIDASDAFGFVAFGP